jgi:hypothetical protein
MINRSQDKDVGLLGSFTINIGALLVTCHGLIWKSNKELLLNFSVGIIVYDSPGIRKQQVEEFAMVETISMFSDINFKESGIYRNLQDMSNELISSDDKKRKKGMEKLLSFCTNANQAQKDNKEAKVIKLATSTINVGGKTALHKIILNLLETDKYIKEDQLKTNVKEVFNNIDTVFTKMDKEITKNPTNEDIERLINVNTPIINRTLNKFIQEIDSIVPEIKDEIIHLLKVFIFHHAKYLQEKINEINKINKISAAKNTVIQEVKKKNFNEYTELCSDVIKNSHEASLKIEKKIEETEKILADKYYGFLENPKGYQDLKDGKITVDSTQLLRIFNVLNEEEMALFDDPNEQLFNLQELRTLRHHMALFVRIHKDKLKEEVITDFHRPTLPAFTDEELGYLVFNNPDMKLLEKLDQRLFYLYPEEAIKDTLAIIIYNWQSIKILQEDKLKPSQEHQSLEQWQYLMLNRNGDESFHSAVNKILKFLNDCEIFEKDSLDRNLFKKLLAITNLNFSYKDFDKESVYDKNEGTNDKSRDYVVDLEIKLQDYVAMLLLQNAGNNSATERSYFILSQENYNKLEELTNASQISWNPRDLVDPKSFLIRNIKPELLKIGNNLEKFTQAKQDIDKIITKNKKFFTQDTKIQLIEDCEDPSLSLIAENFTTLLEHHKSLGLFQLFSHEVMEGRRIFPDIIDRIRDRSNIPNPIDKAKIITTELSNYKQKVNQIITIANKIKNNAKRPKSPLAQYKDVFTIELFIEEVKKNIENLEYKANNRYSVNDILNKMEQLEQIFERNNRECWRLICWIEEKIKDIKREMVNKFDTDIMRIESPKHKEFDDSLIELVRESAIQLPNNIRERSDSILNLRVSHGDFSKNFTELIAYIYEWIQEIESITTKFNDLQTKWKEIKTQINKLPKKQEVKKPSWWKKKNKPETLNTQALEDNIRKFSEAYKANLNTIGDRQIIANVSDGFNIMIQQIKKYNGMDKTGKDTFIKTQERTMDFTAMETKLAKVPAFYKEMKDKIYKKINGKLSLEKYKLSDTKDNLEKKINSIIDQFITQCKNKDNSFDMQNIKKQAIDGAKSITESITRDSTKELEKYFNILGQLYTIIQKFPEPDKGEHKREDTTKIKKTYEFLMSQENVNFCEFNDTNAYVMVEYDSTIGNDGIAPILYHLETETQPNTALLKEYLIQSEAMKNTLNIIHYDNHSDNLHQNLNVTEPDATSKISDIFHKKGMENPVYGIYFNEDEDEDEDDSIDPKQNKKKEKDKKIDAQKKKNVQNKKKDQQPKAIKYYLQLKLSNTIYRTLNSSRNTDGSVNVLNMPKLTTSNSGWKAMDLCYTKLSNEQKEKTNNRFYHIDSVTAEIYLIVDILKNNDFKACLKPEAQTKFNKSIERLKWQANLANNQKKNVQDHAEDNFITPSIKIGNNSIYYSIEDWRNDRDQATTEKNLAIEQILFDSMHSYELTKSFNHPKMQDLFNYTKLLTRIENTPFNSVVGFARKIPSPVKDYISSYPLYLTSGLLSHPISDIVKPITISLQQEIMQEHVQSVPAIGLKLSNTLHSMKDAMMDAVKILDDDIDPGSVSMKDIHGMLDAIGKAMDNKYDVSATQSFMALKSAEQSIVKQQLLLQYLGQTQGDNFNYIDSDRKPRYNSFINQLFNAHQQEKATEVLCSLQTFCTVINPSSSSLQCVSKLLDQLFPFVNLIYPQNAACQIIGQFRVTLRTIEQNPDQDIWNVFERDVKQLLNTIGLYLHLNQKKLSPQMAVHHQKIQETISMYSKSKKHDSDESYKFVLSHPFIGVSSILSHQLSLLINMRKRNFALSHLIAKDIGDDTMKSGIPVLQSQWISLMKPRAQILQQLIFIDPRVDYETQLWSNVFQYKGYYTFLQFSLRSLSKNTYFHFKKLKNKNMQGTILEELKDRSDAIKDGCNPMAAGTILNGDLDDNNYSSLLEGLKLQNFLPLEYKHLPVGTKSFLAKEYAFLATEYAEKHIKPINSRPNIKDFTQLIYNNIDAYDNFLKEFNDFCMDKGVPNCITEENQPWTDKITNNMTNGTTSGYKIESIFKNIIKQGQASLSIYAMLKQYAVSLAIPKVNAHYEKIFIALGITFLLSDMMKKMPQLLQDRILTLDLAKPMKILAQQMKELACITFIPNIHKESFREILYALWLATFINDKITGDKLKNINLLESYNITKKNVQSSLKQINEMMIEHYFWQSNKVILEIENSMNNVKNN